jgi:hypothetical protein
VGTWAPPIDPAAFAYTPGPTTQFTDLAAQSLAGVGDASDSFEGDFLGFLSILPPLGAGIPGLDDSIMSFESALADFNTDEFSPILADLANMGPGIDSAANALSLLGDFGSFNLGNVLPWLNLLASDVATALTNALYAANEAWNVYAMELSDEADIQNLYFLIEGLGSPFYS